MLSDPRSPEEHVKREIRVLEDSATLFRAAASEFVRIGDAAVRANGRFTVALAGGSTPKHLYLLLAGEYRDQVSWSHIHFFFGDERHVPPDHPDSNYRMANEALLSKLPIRPSQVARIKGELKDPSQAAEDYEQALVQFFQLSPGQYPVLDLVLLGTGNEGHTASLFPGTKALHPEQRLVVSNWIGKLYTHRITMTAPVLSRATGVIFMATGKEKALAVKGVLEGPYEPEQLPAQLIQPREMLLWLLDGEAGGLLESVTPDAVAGTTK